MESSNRIAIDVHEFHEALGIESGTQSSDARRWAGAAAEKWDKVRESSVEGVGTVKHLGGETLVKASSVRGKLADKIADRKLRRGEDDRESPAQG